MPTDDVGVTVVFEHKTIFEYWIYVQLTPVTHVIGILCQTCVHVYVCIDVCVYVGGCIHVWLHPVFVQCLLYSVTHFLKALSSLISTMHELADSHTQLLLSYEERTTGNKPEIERNFFKVSIRTNFWNTMLHSFIYS